MKARHHLQSFCPCNKKAKQLRGAKAIPKTTIKKIAELAGVGTATVERVLNERGGVRPDTVEKLSALCAMLIIRVVFLKNIKA